MTGRNRAGWMVHAPAGHTWRRAYSLCLRRCPSAVVRVSVQAGTEVAGRRFKLTGGSITLRPWRRTLLLRWRFRKRWAIPIRTGSYGWFFMGAKRRENYDDWFRCQVEFDASLDEAFGITHTKQQVRPQQFVLEALSGDIEATAHALNSRIRKAHAAISAADRAADAEQVASKRDHILRRLPARVEQSTAELANLLRRKHPALRQRKEEGDMKPSLYKFVEHDLKGTTDFFAHASVDGRFVVVLNPSHPFYKKVYKPLTESDQPKDKALRSQIELLVMAAGRAAAALGTGKALDDFLARFKKEWSDTLAVFLNGVFASQRALLKSPRRQWLQPIDSLRRNGFAGRS